MVSGVVMTLKPSSTFDVWLGDSNGPGSRPHRGILVSALRAGWLYATIFISRNNLLIQIYEAAFNTLIYVI